MGVRNPEDSPKFDQSFQRGWLWNIGFTIGHSFELYANQFAVLVEDFAKLLNPCHEDSIDRALDIVSGRGQHRQALVVISSWLVWKELWHGHPNKEPSQMARTQSMGSCRGGSYEGQSL